jgi:hypothetical protein
MAHAIAIDAVLDAAQGGHFTGRFGAFRIIACRRMPSRRDVHAVGVDLYVWFEGFLVACGAQSVRFDACAGRTRKAESRAHGVEPGAKPPVFRSSAIRSPRSCHWRGGVAGAGVTLAESARSMHVTHPPRPQGRTSRFHSLKAGGRKVRG